MSALKLPHRMQHCRNKPWHKSDWVLLSLHFPWSITWTWAVYWCAPKAGWKRLLPLIGRSRRSLWLQVPACGTFDLSWQDTMPRDGRLHIWKIGRLVYLSAYAGNRASNDGLRLFGRFMWEL